MIRFRNELHRNDIPLFRGAIIHMLQNNNILFHNHAENGLRYAYPLIQYKRLNNKAAIVCMEEGTETIGEFFSCFSKVLRIGDSEIQLELDNIKAEQVLVQVWRSDFIYSIRRWIPFNSENHERYSKMTSLREQLELMEKILIGNVLSFAKGIGVQLQQQLSCSIVSMESKGLITFKHVRFETFDILFKINISLPDYIGLGKGVSHGFGTIVRMNTNGQT